MKEERRGRESELAKEGVSQRGRTNSLASSSTLVAWWFVTFIYDPNMWPTGEERGTSLRSRANGV